MLDQLIDGFEADAFCDFLRSKFPSFSESRRPLRIDGEFPWDSAEQLGVVKTLPGPNGMNMPLMVVVASLPEDEPLRERSSRVRQFNFARKVIGQALATPSPGIEGLITQGLFVFHDAEGNFRLSLVHGRAEGLKLIWSTAKRLSFYIDAGAGNKTFRDRARLDWTAFDKLKEAFSVEKLTKEFYGKLFDWYQWALSDEINVTYPNNTNTDDDEREINEHIIRLITRLMFVWFLKQKRLVPGNLFDPAELKTILKNFDPLKGDSYYRAILQNLFFATLNSQIGEREFAVDAGNIRENKEHFDIKTLYRYGGEFAISQEAVLTLFEKIPFLNGGLFECLDRGSNYCDGFSRNPRRQAHLPNRLFFDREQGLIPLLAQYHFTVEENSPGDEEVALDPELLGKVFENLLGAYNPETKVAARNATGSFYTPREIVNYMVDESLKAHVLQKVGQTFLSAKGDANQGDADIPVCDSSTLDAQTGMSAPPFGAPLTISQRRLPHWHVNGALYWVTFRLADSIPRETLRVWREERDAWMKQHPDPWAEAVWAEYDERFTQRMEQWLDAGMGSRALANTDVRAAVKACLLKFDGDRLRVHAAVIMPTHVHCVIEPLVKGEADIPVCHASSHMESQTGMSASPSSSALSKLLQGIKGASARAANQILGTSGTFWMDESYDHIVRNEKQYRHFIRYIEENPVKAKLSAHEYWLYKGEADIPVCHSSSPIELQTGMSASPSGWEPAVNALFADGTRPRDAALCRQIDDALVTAKILDPACGSGAFPMGILLRMVELLRVLRDIGDDDHAAIYDLKLALIENCIYGGDIQSIAVQISKLRFFISLVCEQKPTNNPRNNYGINTLPNLETKFVAADSLIGLAKPKQRTADGLAQADMFSEEEDPEIKKLKAKLWDVRHKHFLARTYRQKKELRADDKALRKLLADTLRIKQGYAAASAEKMAAWDPYDQNTSATWSDPEWMFNVKDGFDIVIGNPPYISHDRILGKDAIKRTYRTWSPFADIYCYFTERGVLLLRFGGVLSFITSNSFIKADYGSPMRMLLGAENTLRALINIEGSQVFESAIVNTSIVIAQKGAHYSDRNVIVTDASMESMSFSEFLIKRAFCLTSRRFASVRWILAPEMRLQVLDKIRAAGSSLEKQGAKIRLGIATGSNQAFLINEQKRAEFLSKNPQNDLLLKPIIRGRDIERYGYKQSGLYIILAKNGVDVKGQYPDIYEHLDSFGQAFKNRGAKGQCWWNLRACNFYDDFKKAKIVWIELTDRARFALCCEEVYCINSAYFMLPPPQYDSRVILGILNSATIDFFVKAFGETSGMGTVRWINNVVADIPIPCIPSKEQSHIATIVDRILAAKKVDPDADISGLEAKIDRLVYALYGLTEDEIVIVEGSGGETKESKAAGRKAKAQSTNVAAHSKDDSRPKRPRQRKKLNLPPSLPGWD